MAAFIDLEYYINTYKGVAVPADSFYFYAERASTAVDFHTFERASAIVTAAEDAALINKIKMATCAAAERTADQSQAKRWETTRSTLRYHPTRL